MIRCHLERRASTSRHGRTLRLAMSARAPRCALLLAVAATAWACADDPGESSAGVPAQQGGSGGSTAVGGAAGERPGGATASGGAAGKSGAGSGAAAGGSGAGLGAGAGGAGGGGAAGAVVGGAAGTGGVSSAGTGGAAGANGSAATGGAAGASAGGSGASGSAGGSAAAGGTSTGGAGGAAGAGGKAPVTPPTDQQLAKVVKLDDVAVFQAIKVEVATDGQAVLLANRSAPIVAGREAVVRAYVSPVQPAGFAARPLWARLIVEKGAASETLESKRTIGGASKDDDPASVFRFDVPENLVGPNTTYRISVLDPQAAPAPAGGNDAARFPRNGQPQALQAQALAGALKIRFVPVRYQTGSANTVPDLGPARLDAIRAYLRALFPVAAVNLSVGDELAWDLPPVNQGNFDFDKLLPRLTARKVADNAAPDVYYVGVVVPAATYAAYCGGACRNGLAYQIPSASDQFGSQRVGGVVGYWDSGSLAVLAHELGHLHGLAHSQCETSEASYAFPFQDGGTHVWGFDQRTNKFLAPTETTDLMGNCAGRWMSAYTSRALFARLTAMAK